MSLIRLIYVSTSATLLNDEALMKILESSVRHNHPQKVTGMLLYFDGSFMQVLEGEEAAVEKTMSRIREDKRHHSIFMLMEDRIEEREFGMWAMGFKSLHSKDLAAWVDFSPFNESGFCAERIAARPGLALEILTKFAEVNSR